PQYLIKCYLFRAALRQAVKVMLTEGLGCGITFLSAFSGLSRRASCLIMPLQPKTMPSAAPVALPAVPVLAVNAKQAALLTTEGEITLLPHARAQMEVHNRPVMVCHAPWTRQRLGADDLLAFDVLELFAFVHPAKFCAPTPSGLARALGLPVPKNFEDLPPTIMEAAQVLLRDLRAE